MLIVDVEQGSPEWLAARLGIPTASKFKDAVKKMTRASEGRKAGDPHGDSDKYRDELVCERIHQEPVTELFQTWQMRRGQEQEAPAADLYERRTGCLVEPVGIILTDDRAFGYSPDRMVLEQEGGIEIKVPSACDKVLNVWLDPESVIDEYTHQIMGGLWITGWKWIDLVVYTPWLAKAGKDSFIHRFHRDEDAIEQLESDLWAFKKRVDSREAAVRALASPAPAVETPPWTDKPAPTKAAPVAMPANLFA